MKKHSATGGAKNRVSNEVHLCALCTTVTVSKGKQDPGNLLIFIRKYLFAEKQNLCC